MKSKLSSGWWNYRFCKFKVKNSVYYSLIEVYYDENGSIVAWDENPTQVYVESKEDTKVFMKQIKKAKDAKVVSLEDGTLKEIDEYMEKR